tara:strand:+ start:3934 stop:7428 length:3495 start_codon:yes stop_codon:yes gene_type:complete
MSTPDSTHDDLPRDPRHEQLCAYLMGEGSPAERLELEALLAKDADLAAERDRLAGVLGLVQGAFAGEERLSEEALSSLLTAAQSSDTGRVVMASDGQEDGSHVGPRLNSGHGAPAGGSPSHHAPSRRGHAAGPFLRAAAAVLLIATGCWVAFRHPGTQSYDQELAHADIQVGGSASAAERLLIEEALRGRFDRLESLYKSVAIDDSVSAESAARQKEFFKQAQSAFLRDQFGDAENYANLILKEDPRNQTAVELKALAGEMRQQITHIDATPDDQGQWRLSLEDLDGLEAMGEPNPTAQAGYVDVHQDPTPTLTDITYGLEGLASQGLTAGGAGATDSNSAGSPSAELALDEQQGAGMRARTELVYSGTVSKNPVNGAPSLSAGIAPRTLPKDAAPSSPAETRQELLRLEETVIEGRYVPSPKNDSRRGSGGGGGRGLQGPGASAPGPGGPATPGGVGPFDKKAFNNTIGLGGGTASPGRVAETTAAPQLVDAPGAPKVGVVVDPAPTKAETRSGRSLLEFKALQRQLDSSIEVTGEDRFVGESIERHRLPEEVDGPDSTTALFDYELDYDVEPAARRAGAFTETSRGRMHDGGEDETRRPVFTPAQIDRGVEIQFERIRDDCRRRPHERPRDMFFRWWGDNPWEITETDKLSTFAADVDTASYVLARRYLRNGNLPTREQIRTEEFVNYFDPDIPVPTEGTFAIQTEMAPSLFGGSERRWQLRVGVRGMEVHDRKPLSLTFVIDTSGSMEENQRLELVKHALRLLVSQLDGRDEISIVAFNKEARQILPMTSAANRGVIESALHPLTPDGGTNAEAGLVMGYEVAMAGLNAQSHNRVILLSDGVANIGETDQDRINANITRHREAGIYLNTIGVGMSNHNDVFLEQLANKGDGVCDYVDDAASTERAIVERFTGALVPIASDVKIQVEFDPAQVLRYRLLGYENRAIADADFRNDKVDAGEIGAGHQVTAIYEIERAGGPAPMDTPIAKVNLRWKEPKTPLMDKREVEVTEISQDVHVADSRGSWDAASVGFRRASLVAQFAECLRASTHARGDSLEALRFEFQRLADLPELAQDPETAELPGLVQRAIDLGLGRRFLRSELGSTVDEYRRHKYLCEQLDELGKRPKSNGIEREDLIRLKQTNDELERRIQDLLRKDLETRVR